MTIKLNPQVITDDMMYEGNVSAYEYVKELDNSRVTSVDMQRIREDKLWGEIRRTAKTNKVLHDALERVILLYHLTEKDNGKST